MALVTTAATILKTYEYSETSKILRLLTRDDGLCSVIAKGARRPKSRFGGVLEPFTDGVATYYAKQGRDLHTLSGFELRKERQSLGREIVRYGGAALVTEIALRFASGSRDLRLFRGLRRALDRLVEEPGDVEGAALAEGWRLIACLGFSPNLDRCPVCGRPALEGDTSHFDLAAGGLRCGRCGPRRPGRAIRALSRSARRELVDLARDGGGNGALRTGRVQRALLRDFIVYHLPDDRPLNSFRFLDGQLE